MAKHVKPNSPRKQQNNLIPIFGGLGINELMIILLSMVLIIIFLILKIINIIGFTLFLILISLTVIINLYLITTKSKNNLKGWEKIILIFSNIFTKRKFSEESLYKLSFKGKQIEIIDDALKIGEEYYCAYYIDGINLNSINDFEREKTISKFKNLINKQENEFYIHKINEDIDFSKTIDSYEEISKTTKNKKIKKSNKETIDKLKDLNSKSNRYALIFKFESEDNYRNNIKTLDNDLLYESRFAQEKINPQNLEKIIMNTFSNAQGIFVSNNYIVENHENEKMYSAFLFVSDFEKVLNTGWLSRMFNANNYNVYLNMKKGKTEPILEEIRKEIKKNDNFISESSNYHEINKRKEINHLLYSEIDDIKRNSSTASEFSIIIKINSPKKANLKQIQKMLSNDLKKDGLEISLMSFRQFDAIKHIMPTMKSNCRETVQWDTTSKFISSSWPFMKGNIFDGEGLILGPLEENEEVNQINIKSRKNSRINSNMFVLASSGAGKTVTISQFINDQIKSGDTVFIIDPENEYSNLVNKYDGTIINFSDKNNKINPLQVIKNGEGDFIKEHLIFLDSFFKNLFVDIDNLQLSKLKEYIEESYKVKKITDKNIESKYEKIKWPTFDDVKKIYDKKLKTEDPTIKLKMIELGTYIHEVTTGAYSKLWNCETTLDFNFDLVVFDISKYVENIRVVSSLMNLITNIVWGEINNIYENNKNSKNEKWSSLIIDEAHLLMNKNNIDSLEWISQVTKRIRKRNGSLFIITQNISDFIGDDSISHISSRIINNCTYSLIGQLKSNDLNELSEMYKGSGGMSKYERDFLKNANKFQFVLSLGQEKKLYLKNTRPNSLNSEVLGWEE